jgi:hypothetical protein
MIENKGDESFIDKSMLNLTFNEKNLKEL